MIATRHLQTQNNHITRISISILMLIYNIISQLLTTTDNQQLDGKQPKQDNLIKQTNSIKRPRLQDPIYTKMKIGFRTKNKKKQSKF